MRVTRLTSTTIVAALEDLAAHSLFTLNTSAYWRYLARFDEQVIGDKGEEIRRMV